MADVAAVSRYAYNFDLPTLAIQPAGGLGVCKKARAYLLDAQTDDVGGTGYGRRGSAISAIQHGTQ